MQVGDLVRPWNARKAMGLVVKTKGLYIEVQWIGKSCAYNRTYQKYKLEVISEKK